MSLIIFIEYFNSVTGLILNLLLFYAIRKFSHVRLGAYKHLLAIFTVTDVCLVILHVIVCPRAILVGTTQGVVTDTVIDDRRITALYISLQSVPFILLNIHFLYRYWVVRRPHLIQLFSRRRFQNLLVWGTLGALFAWYLLCLHGTTGQEDSVGRRKVITDYERKHGKRIENAWIVFDYWCDDRIDMVLITTFLSINIFMTSSLILVSSLAILTFYHIRQTYQMSTQAGRLQKRLLIALCAQASVPTIFVYIPYLVTINIPFWRVNVTILHDFGPQFTTFFPVLDAAVVIIMIADYREGLMGLCRKNPELSILPFEQFTAAV